MIVLVLAWAGPAHAAFPGANGKIAFEDFSDIHTINPDGSGATQLTTDPASDIDPSWSPDGERIAFMSNRDGLGFQVYVMNPDGSGQTRITDPPSTAVGPDWSPDGQRIVFSRNGDLWTMNADGSNQSALTNLAGSEYQPAWSPDGSRIAFVWNLVIYSIRPDGTGLTQITGNPEPSPYFNSSTDRPDWSPDGARIVYRLAADNDGEVCYFIRTIRPDGTGRLTVYDPICDDSVGSYVGPGAWSPDGTRIAADDGRLFTVQPDGTGFSVIAPVFGLVLDWQPLPADQEIARHVRPKGATPWRVPLVPAYEPCTAPNRTHGPPLAFGSCNPPQPASTYLTAGAGDGSPTLARSAGFVRLDVRPGTAGAPNDADVFIRFNITNVMRAADLSEYTGELRPELTVRRTDADLGPNIGGPGAGPRSTSMDLPFVFSVPCAPTPGSSLDASTCGLSTSVNALVPDAIWEFNRNVWALDALRVYDGGPDEDADTQGDNSLFMTQGVFVP